MKAGGGLGKICFPPLHFLCVLIFRYVIWMGWLMILALLYSFIPAMILGRKKLPFAERLHIKVLLVDSQAQKADWMTAAATIVGIIGIGFGSRHLMNSFSISEWQ